MNKTSKHIELECLPNTRDLGGMITKDGRTIRSGMLLRSGHLNKASDSDMEFLSSLVDVVIDFRTTSEKTRQPDRLSDGMKYLELPILDEKQSVAGVARDYDSIEKVFDDMQKDPRAGINHMVSIYRAFVTNEVAIAGYKNFVKTLLNHEGKAVLWHCSAGKDRCGVATVIILEILGVSREDIYQDYILTNEYNKEDAARIVNRFIERNGVTDEILKDGIAAFWSADSSFLDETYHRVEEVYGSFYGFLEKALGVTPVIREELRKKYLE